MIDLSWKIMFLSEINREKYASQIDTLIDKLYEYETPEGGWPYPFDKNAKTADFISYNAVLALAEAGRRPETDEHLPLAVKAMLAAQRPEGSWEGDPVYQGFNTPFRATQFAVMALSTLYPGTTKAEELGCGLSPHRPRISRRTIFRSFCSNSISSGIWLPSHVLTPDSRSAGRKRSATGARSRGPRPGTHGGSWRAPCADQGAG